MTHQGKERFVCRILTQNMHVLPTDEKMICDSPGGSIDRRCRVSLNYLGACVCVFPCRRWGGWSVLQRRRRRCWWTRTDVDSCRPSVSMGRARSAFISFILYFYTWPTESTDETLDRLKMCIGLALHRNPDQSYGAPTATRHRWTCLNHSQASRYSIYIHKRNRRLTWPGRLVIYYREWEWFICPQRVTHQRSNRPVDR